MKSNQPRRPRNDAPRTARPRLCRDSVGALLVALHPGSVLPTSRRAVVASHRTAPHRTTLVDLTHVGRAFVARHPCWLSGRRYPARAHSGAAAMGGLGLGAQVRASFHARRSCLSAASSSTPAPGPTSQRSRSEAKTAPACARAGYRLTRPATVHAPTQRHFVPRNSKIARAVLSAAPR
jgi:hypothetical protein